MNMELVTIIIEEVGGMIQASQDALNDRLDALEERLKIVDNTNTHILEGVPNKNDLQTFGETIHDRIDSVADTIKDITGLPAKNTTGKSKLEDRIAHIEQGLASLDRRYVDNLEVVRNSLIEVKGQISDPIGKTNAIEELRTRLKTSYTPLR